MVYYNKSQKSDLEQIFKSYLSSDYFLQLKICKEESLVIAYHNDAVNTG